MTNVNPPTNRIVGSSEPNPDQSVNESFGEVIDFLLTDEAYSALGTVVEDFQQRLHKP